MRVKYKYLFSLALVSPVELTFTAVSFATAQADIPLWPFIVSNLFFLVFLNVLGGLWIMRPIRHYFWSEGSYRDAVKRVRVIAAWSALWVGFLAAIFAYVKFTMVPQLLGWDAAMFGSSSSFTMSVIFALFFGYLTYFNIGLLQTHESPEVFSTYHLSTSDVRGRFALKIFIVIMLTAILPQWYLISEVHVLGVGEERARLMQVILVALLSVLVGILFVSRAIDQPVSVLRDGVQRYLRGETGVRLPIHSVDEFGALVSSFNDIVDRLRERLYERQVAGRLVSQHVARIATTESAAPVETSQSTEPVTTEATLVHVRLLHKEGLMALNKGEAFEAINAIWQEIDQLVDQYGGALVNVLPQSALATFNVPKESLDHARSAITFADKVARYLEDVRQTIPGCAHLAVAMGVFTGQVMVGDVVVEGIRGHVVAGEPRDLAEMLSLSAAGTEHAVLIDPSTIQQANMVGAEVAVHALSPHDDGAENAEGGVYALAS